MCIYDRIIHIYMMYKPLSEYHKTEDLLYSPVTMSMVGFLYSLDYPMWRQWVSYKEIYHNDHMHINRCALEVLFNKYKLSFLLIRSSTCAPSPPLVALPTRTGLSRRFAHSLYRWEFWLLYIHYIYIIQCTLLIHTQGAVAESVEYCTCVWEIMGSSSDRDKPIAYDIYSCRSLARCSALVG